MLIKCNYCEKEFNRKPSEINKKYNFCCKECYNKAIKENKQLNGNYRGGKNVKCHQCGKEIYKTPSEIKNNKNNFCSQKCLGEWHSKNLIGEKASNYKGALITKICKACGEEFATYHKNQIYCSIPCRDKFTTNRKIIKCVNCHTDFERTASAIYWSNRRGCENVFCSAKCKQEYHVGENHPNWIKDRDLLKDQNKSIRWSKDMSDWRKSIYNRDDYTCQMCGSKSSKDNAVILNAHHIERFVDNEELRFDVDNGITLCEDCHKLTYGKEKDFEEQFKNIINYI